MLSADRRALQQRLRQNAAVIQAKEVELFSAMLWSMGSQAITTAGFAFWSLLREAPDPAVRAYVPSMRAMFTVVTSATVGVMLLVALSATLGNVLGVGLAVKGPLGSMKRAAEGLREERRLAFRLYGLGGGLFMSSCVFFAWSRLQTSESVAVTLAMMGFGAWFVHDIPRVLARFRIPPDAAVSGAVDIVGDWWCRECRDTVRAVHKYCSLCGARRPLAQCSSCREEVRDRSQTSCPSCGCQVYDWHEVDGVEEVRKARERRRRRRRARQTALGVTDFLLGPAPPDDEPELPPEPREGWYGWQETLDELRAAEGGGAETGFDPCACLRLRRKKKRRRGYDRVAEMDDGDSCDSSGDEEELLLTSFVLGDSSEDGGGGDGGGEEAFFL